MFGCECEWISDVRWSLVWRVAVWTRWFWVFWKGAHEYLCGNGRTFKPIVKRNDGSAMQKKHAQSWFRDCVSELWKMPVMVRLVIDSIWMRMNGMRVYGRPLNVASWIWRFHVLKSNWSVCTTHTHTRTNITKNQQYEADMQSLNSHRR